MPPENEEINVDELLSSIETPTPERAMTGGSEEPKAEEAPAAAPEPQAWDGKPWEFDWNGKKIAPDSQEKARTWMAQGYNYSQRMGELNKTHAQRMAEAEARAKAAAELEERFSPYSKVDEYAQKNPQWWQHVLKQYEAAQQNGQPVDPALAAVIKPLEEKLGKYDAYFQQMEQAKAAEAQAKAAEEQQREDTALVGEIESIRKQYPNIDLSAADPATGETLELRVLKHAQAIGTGSFKAAFRDYLHDTLVEQAKANGREAIAKEAQANAKKGILGKTPAPVKSGAKPVNTKAPWNDPQFDGASILKELGL